MHPSERNPNDSNVIPDNYEHIIHYPVQLQEERPYDKITPSAFSEKYESLAPSHVLVQKQLPYDKLNFNDLSDNYEKPHPYLSIHEKELYDKIKPSMDAENDGQSQSCLEQGPYKEIKLSVDP